MPEAIVRSPSLCQRLDGPDRKVKTAIHLSMSVLRPKQSACWHIGMLACQSLAKTQTGVAERSPCQVSWRRNSCYRPFHHSWKPFLFPEAVYLFKSVLRPEQSSCPPVCFWQRPKLALEKRGSVRPLEGGTLARDPFRPVLFARGHDQGLPLANSEPLYTYLSLF